MRATAKGYLFAITNPEEAARILLESVPELNPELVMASQIWLADRYQAEAETWGLQKLETWENYGKWLLEHGLIEEMPELEKAFTNAFID
jgi:ABC-type nitrate/sulfonate/bicarbonate transport system substrate-binding protein